MDAFIDSPLNKSHRFERKAEDLAKCGRFDEAINYHRKAKECLLEAKQLTRSNSAISSIEAQINFHENQEKILAHRQAVIRSRVDAYKEKQQRQLQQQQQQQSRKKCEQQMFGKEDRNVSSLHSKAIFRNDSAQFENNEEVEIEQKIYRTIEENDSLVQFLICREDDCCASSPKDDSSKSGAMTLSNYKTGNKVPKDDKTVIEELRTNNQQLRELIHELIGELEKLRKENSDLKNEVKKCREEQISYIPELPPLEPPNLLY
ncbi:nuclear receptor-binding factor 2-like protein [Dinothrombium tinctorium]|uniref:Nuclear receptor-binding factor 2-like protein n=1 Tax=Dinothrombium tinctorium TaxID=1965070 RepID=A0A3S3P3G9_9ACAR|nr:nuclear receptor-binding factor 2-like protein [Dinothrombium tinctorium]